MPPATPSAASADNNQEPTRMTKQPVRENEAPHSIWRGIRQTLRGIGICLLAEEPGRKAGLLGGQDYRRTAFSGALIQRVSHTVVSPGMVSSSMDPLAARTRPDGSGTGSVPKLVTTSHPFGRRK